ncbi:unnamed protein product [Rotaria sp. Silwood2]|nr:unnamed protein product [Rotaria sp. Silwood2]
MSCHSHIHIKSSSTAVGLILGRGINACYIENLDKVDTWDDDYSKLKQVVINMQSSAFGENGCISHIRRKYDEEIDFSSINPGKQM